MVTLSYASLANAETLKPYFVKTEQINPNYAFYSFQAILNPTITPVDAYWWQLLLVFKEPIVGKIPGKSYGSFKTPFPGLM